jgi:hypothetical protein
MMHRLKSRVYGCALVCLILATPVICFAITLESIWARLATLGLLGIAPMVDGYLYLGRMTTRYKRSS